MSEITVEEIENLFTSLRENLCNKTLFVSLRHWILFTGTSEKTGLSSWVVPCDRKGLIEDSMLAGARSGIFFGNLDIVFEKALLRLHESMVGRTKDSAIMDFRGTVNASWSGLEMPVIGHRFADRGLPRSLLDPLLNSDDAHDFEQEIYEQLREIGIRKVREIGLYVNDECCFDDKPLYQLKLNDMRKGEEE